MSIYTLNERQPLFAESSNIIGIVCIFTIVTMIAAIHVHRFLWIRINSIKRAKCEMWTGEKRIWVVYKLVLNSQHTELAGSIDVPIAVTLAQLFNMLTYAFSLFLSFSERKLIFSQGWWRRETRKSKNRCIVREEIVMAIIMIIIVSVGELNRLND